MADIQFRPLTLEGLTEVTPFFAEDHRGYNLKGYEKSVFEAAGIYGEFSESNESLSRRGVLRGLHFQSSHPQAKLVRAVTGKIFDVAVDLRPQSSTFGRWEGIYLSSRQHNALFVPAGFAHGFLVVSEEAIVTYHCWGKYLPQFDTGINWQDPDIAVDWPVFLVDEVILSKKDGQLPSFREYQRLTV